MAGQGCWSGEQCPSEQGWAGWGSPELYDPLAWNAASQGYNAEAHAMLIHLDLAPILQQHLAAAKDSGRNRGTVSSAGQRWQKMLRVCHGSDVLQLEFSWKRCWRVCFQHLHTGAHPAAALTVLSACAGDGAAAGKPAAPAKIAVLCSKLRRLLVGREGACCTAASLLTGGRSGCLLSLAAANGTHIRRV